MSETIAVKCWTCGLTRGTQIPGPPTLSVDVAVAADSVGWLAFADLRRSRVLVFCTDRCARDAKGKDGSFRLRPPNQPRAARASRRKEQPPKVD